MQTGTKLIFYFQLEADHEEVQEAAAEEAPQEVVDHGKVEEVDEAVDVEAAIKISLSKDSMFGNLYYVKYFSLEFFMYKIIHKSIQFQLVRIESLLTLSIQAGNLAVLLDALV
jgi:hypothetical protein